MFSGVGADPSIAACIKDRGVVSSLDPSVVLDVVRMNRNVVAHSSIIAGCGRRRSLHCVNSKVGFGPHRGPGGGGGGVGGVGWTEEKLVIGLDPQGKSGRVRAAVALQADFEARPEPKVTYVPLELIASEAEFDRVLSEAQERSEPIIIEWMASWCRKCLYLKPKLEKLAAVFHPSIKFYYVDVNAVPQSMVKRAEVTQMPTIQLWRNGAREAQVIGGHEANKVVHEVRDMITKGMPTS